MVLPRPRGDNKNLGFGASAGTRLALIYQEKRMAKLAVGTKVPEFKLAASSGMEIALSGLKGKTLVLYFYPKDSTPGCTQEGLDFSALYADFQACGAEVFGVSRDSVASHDKFKAKQGFPFELLSDPDETLCKMFDVIKKKNLYGKKVMGIERSTFIIDGKGVLREAMRKIKVKDHARHVLEVVREPLINPGRSRL